MNKIRSTKDELLLLLKKNKGLMIEEIMNHFSISEVAIRKQLRVLENQDFIFKTKHKQEIGRPYYTYSLTDKGHRTFPNQYEQLPVELLEDLEELQGYDVVSSLLDKRMENQGKGILEQLDAAGFDEKVHQLASIQNKEGYMMEVHKTSEGDYVLTNFNCPIANIASKYRQVCSSEKKIYHRVFEGSEVIPERYITSGSHACKWIIKSPNNKK